MDQHPFTKIEGSLEVKLPTIWTYGKAEMGRVREKKSQKKEDAGARKGTRSTFGS